MAKKDTNNLDDDSVRGNSVDFAGDSITPIEPGPIPDEVFFKDEIRMDYWRSWAVLVAGTMVFVVSFGMVTSFGIYVEHLLDAFRCSKSEVALVGSVAYGCMCICGPFSNVLYQLIGSRLSIILGSLIASGGYIIAYYSADVMQLALCYGVVGVGLGITITPTLAVQTEYFLKYRYFAISFVTVGSAAGLFIIPPILERLIDEFNWRGSMLLNAGLTLQLVIAGAIMRSTRPKLSLKTVRFAQVFHLSLFRAPEFLLLCVSCMMWGATNYTFLTTLPSSMETEGGLRKQTVAFLMSVVGMGSVLGRISAAVINHQSGVNRPLLYATALLISTSQVWSTIISKDAAAFGVVGFFFGFGFGLMLTTLAPVVVDLFGVEKLPGAQGFLAFFVGFGGLIGPVIAGHIRDSATTDAAFMFAGSLGLCGATVSFMIVLLNCLRPDKPHVESTSQEKGTAEQDDAYMDAVEGKVTGPEALLPPLTPKSEGRDIQSSDRSSSDSEESDPMMTPNSYRAATLTTRRDELTDQSSSPSEPEISQSTKADENLLELSDDFHGIPGFSDSFNKSLEIDPNTSFRSIMASRCREDHRKPSVTRYQRTFWYPNMRQ